MDVISICYGHNEQGVTQAWGRRSGLKRIMFFEFYTTSIVRVELIVLACIALHVLVEISQQIIALHCMALQASKQEMKESF